MRGRAAVVIATMTIVAWLLARGVGELIGGAVAPNTRLREPVSGTARARADRAAIGCAILARNAFDSATGAIDCEGSDAEQPDTGTGTGTGTGTEPPACDGSVRLVATYVEREGEEERIAMIRDARGSALLYAPGMSIGEQLVDAIDPGRVLLRRNDVTCAIALFDPRPPQPVAAPPAPALVSPLEGVRVVGERLEVRAGAITRAIASPETIAGTLRAVPVPDGLRLHGIARQHPLTALGVRNGDVIRSVDGHALGSPDAWLEALSAIRRTGAHEIAIARRGEEVTLGVDVTP